MLLCIPLRESLLLISQLQSDCSHSDPTLPPPQKTTTTTTTTTKQTILKNEVLTLYQPVCWSTFTTESVNKYNYEYYAITHYIRSIEHDTTIYQMALDYV